MNKQGVCSCGNTVIIPTTECIYNCGKCRQTSLFLCHIIPLPKDFVLVMCPQCQQYYTIFNCPKCQGIAALKNFKSGHTYSCTCGLQATFL